jgi:SpoVK/Ycf46/Vps4 family AAA+-type ATPase
MLINKKNFRQLFLLLCLSSNLAFDGAEVFDLFKSGVVSAAGFIAVFGLQEIFKDYLNRRVQLKEIHDLVTERLQVSYFGKNIDTSGFSPDVEKEVSILKYQIQKKQKELAKGIFTKKKICENIILYGPPGVGKNSFVYKIAELTKVPLFAVTLQYIAERRKKNPYWSLKGVIDEINKYLLKNNKVGILFLDEIDFYAQDRNTAFNNRDLLLELLFTLDGLFAADQSRLVIISATNYLNSLDPAVVRPGRFGKKIEFDYLSPDKIKLFIDFCAQKIGLSLEKAEKEDLLKKCINKSQAEIFSAVHELGLAKEVFSN